MADSSISKIYQFISDNYQNIEAWKEDVDQAYGNSDGTLVKTEARSFLLKNIDDWCGEDKSKANDLINKFWKSIDTIVTGKVGTTTISNKNALNEDELKNASKNLKIASLVSAYVSSQQIPQDFKQYGVGENWQQSVKESLANKAFEAFKSYKYDENKTEEFEQKVKDFIKENFKSSSALTNANLYKNIAIDSAQATTDGKDYSDVLKKDEKLDKIIESYIKSIKDNPDVNYKEIQDTINCLVNDYIATAGIGNGGRVGSSKAFDIYETDEWGVSTGKVAKSGAETTSAERLQKFGYKSNKLNDLQIAVLTDRLTTAITNSLTKNSVYIDNKDYIGAKITSFVDEKINSGNDFKTINTKIDDYVAEFGEKISDFEKELKEEK